MAYLGVIISFRSPVQWLYWIIARIRHHLLFSAGKGCGSIVGGIIFEEFNAVVTFGAYSVSAFAFLVIAVIINMLIIRPRKIQREEEMKGNSLISSGDMVSFVESFSFILHYGMLPHLFRDERHPSPTNWLLCPNEDFILLFHVLRLLMSHLQRDWFKSFFPLLTSRCFLSFVISSSFLYSIFFIASYCT